MMLTRIFRELTRSLVTFRSDDVEDMRERMKGETGLVIVGGADDGLRVCKKKKKLEGITQSMVDRCIMVREHSLFYF